MIERFKADPALRPLKAFQRATVDYVSRRLLIDEDAVRHFLVADEVGLGKTMVARGVIARTIEALQDTVRTSPPRYSITACVPGFSTIGPVAKRIMSSDVKINDNPMKILPVWRIVLSPER